MKELSSYQLDFSKKLTTKEITYLYHRVLSSEHDIYLYQNGHIADAGNFPKLVSFFLLTNADEPFVLIIDGENPTETFKNIKQLFNPHVKRSIIRTRHKNNDDISVVV